MSLIARTVFGASVALLLLGAPAASADVAMPSQGYTYFNRPGADMAAHNQAIEACVESASLSRSLVSRTASLAAMENRTPPVRSLGEAVVGALFWGPRFSNGHLGTSLSNLENCMVVQGWRVVRLPDREGRSLAAAPQSQLVEALSNWVGAEEPEGQVVRVWRNEAISSDSERFSELPRFTAGGLLSLKAATERDEQIFESRVHIYQPGRGFPAGLRPFDRVAHVDAGQVDRSLQNGGVIMLSVTGNSAHNGFGVILQDGDSATTRTVWLAEGMRDFRKGRIFAFPVPQGRWRLEGLFSNSGQILDFCWGAPAFDVGIGQVIWAGAFDLASPDLTPDMTIDAPRTWLAGGSSNAIVLPARYENGALSECDGSVFYKVVFDTMGAG